MTDIYFIYW